MLVSLHLRAGHRDDVDCESEHQLKIRDSEAEGPLRGQLIRNGMMLWGDFPGYGGLTTRDGLGLTRCRVRAPQGTTKDGQQASTRVGDFRRLTKITSSMAVRLEGRER